MTQISTLTDNDLIKALDAEAGEVREISYGDLSAQIISESPAGSFQFESSPSDPILPPANITIPAQFYNSDSGFIWNWDLNGFQWVKSPKVYRVWMQQADTDPPTESITYENTIGFITWSRTSSGTYTGTMAPAVSFDSSNTPRVLLFVLARQICGQLIHLAGTSC